MRAPGRLVAALAGGAQLTAGFLAWNEVGQAGLDVAGPAGATIAVSLVALAGLPLVGLLLGDHGWPRLASGTATAWLVLAHLGTGPDGVATVGVLVAVWASIGQWLAAALATGPLEVPRLAPA